VVGRAADVQAQVKVLRVHGVATPPVPSVSLWTRARANAALDGLVVVAANGQIGGVVDFKGVDRSTFVREGRLF